MDIMQQVVNQERLKDFYRQAENERLARQIPKNESDMLRNARNMLGRGLVTAGQKLLDEKQR